MTSVLDLIKSACRRSAQTVPTTLVTSPSDFELQYLEVFYELAEDLLSRGLWPQLKKTHTFTTTSADTYAFPTDYYAACVDTAWDTTNQWPLKGPVTDSEFARQTYWFGPTYTKTTFRIFSGPLTGDKKPFQMVPVAADLDFAFDYISNLFIYDSTGATGKALVTADTDICVFPEETIKVGWPHFWYKSRGQDNSKAEAQYEKMISRTIFRLVGPVISSRTPHGDTLVPFNTAEGGWNVS